MINADFLWEDFESMALTKADIADSLSKQLGMTKDKCFEMIETLLGVVKENLADGEDVLISGFGKFCVKEKRRRKGRNPQTGADMILPPRRVVTFQYSGNLKDKLNRE